MLSAGVYQRHGIIYRVGVKVNPQLLLLGSDLALRRGITASMFSSLIRVISKCHLESELGAYKGNIWG